MFCFCFSILVLLLLFFFFIQKPLPYCSGRLMYADMSHLPTNKNGKVHRACTSTVYADINHSAKRKVKTGFKPRIPTMWNIKYIKLTLRRTGERGEGGGGGERRWLPLRLWSFSEIFPRQSNTSSFQWPFVYPSNAFWDKFVDGQLLWLRDMTS